MERKRENGPGRGRGRDRPLQQDNGLTLGAPPPRQGALNHPHSLEIRARLVHAEAGSRVVEVRARQGSRRLGSALGEAPTAEEAEERALARLLERLQRHDQPASGQEAAPPVATPVIAERSAVPAPRPATQPPAPSTTLADASPVPTPPAAALAEPSRPALGPVSGGARESNPPIEPPADPDDWSAELARLDLELRRLGWDRQQEETYLKRAFGHPSRSRLTAYADLNAYLSALAGLSPGSDPASAPVPLRRRDLLLQGEQLIQQLGWSADQGRLFLQEHLGAGSRQRLNEAQLLQFNMLLEGELLARGTAASSEATASSEPG